MYVPTRVAKLEHRESIFAFHDANSAVTISDNNLLMIEVQVSFVFTE